MRLTPSASRIPNDTPGLRFICRESLDYGGSHFDHPLGSRYEEMDAVVVFDDVLVPWENVLLYRDVNRCNQAYSRTGAVVHMTHQVVVKNIAKTEFLLGLAADAGRRHRRGDPAAHPGEARRDLGEPGDHARLPARRRGRRPAG